MEIRCPYCKSYDVIEWDDGWFCCTCGQEFDELKRRFTIR